MELFDAVCSSGGQVFYPSTEEEIAKITDYQHKTSYGLEPSADFSIPLEVDGDVSIIRGYGKTHLSSQRWIQQKQYYWQQPVCNHFSLTEKEYLPPLLEYNPQNNRSQYLIQIKPP